MINTIKNHDVPVSTPTSGALAGGARLLAISTLLCLVLAACGDKKSDTPAAVVVNGEALSAAELKFKLSQYDHLPAERKSALAADLLKSMIDTELLRQAAIKEKLDTDEIIRARIASTTRLILANAYLEKQSAAIAKPSESEIKTYFDQHPELYSDRKIYDLEELMIKVLQADATEVKAKLGDGKNYNDFVAWLGQKKLLNNSQHLSAAAEDMREEILGKLKNLKAGDVIALDGKDQLSVIRVNGVESQPIPFEKARPIIEDKLYKRRKTEGMDNMFKQLREQAKIEYVAPYTENGIVSVKPK